MKNDFIKKYNERFNNELNFILTEIECDAINFAIYYHNKKMNNELYCKNYTVREHWEQYNFIKKSISDNIRNLLVEDDIKYGATEFIKNNGFIEYETVDKVTYWHTKFFKKKINNIEYIIHINVYDNIVNCFQIEDTFVENLLFSTANVEKFVEDELKRYKLL